MLRLCSCQCVTVRQRTFQFIAESLCLGISCGVAREGPGVHGVVHTRYLVRPSAKDPSSAAANLPRCSLIGIHVSFVASIRRFPDHAGGMIDRFGKFGNAVATLFWGLHPRLHDVAQLRGLKNRADGGATELSLGFPPQAL
jgi:hypothetical protein